ncbi:MAG: transglycosylase domain-containing protein [Deltaproteobacteria bacterium]|nr:transglycosylase domain-containing protein [Deltaproteobacteria bacterium]
MSNSHISSKVDEGLKKVKSFAYMYNRLFKIFIFLTIPLTIGFVIYISTLTVIITKKFSGPKWDIPSKVYSDSFQLYPGMDIFALQLKERLERLGYQSSSEVVHHPGEYQVQHENGSNQMTWTIYLNDFSYPLKNFSGFLVQLDITDTTITHISKLSLGQKKGDPQEEIFLVELEPELITEFFEGSREDRQVVKLQDVPSNLLNAIISVEDARFLEHAGLDPRAIFRAFLANLKAGTVVQGGSTITQQLVKNFFLTQKRTLLRKLNEALMSFIVESRYSKDEILEAYVNEVYFGQRGSAGIYGISEASRFYFSKPLSKLTLAECALLGGIIRGILAGEYEGALQEPLRVKKISTISNSAPYFVDFVRAELLEKYPSKVLTTQGLKIFTTLDMSLQFFADQALQTTLKQLELQWANLKEDLAPGERLQGAFIALHPQTGFIRALVGGRDYNESQFNRITQARRQPGSLFKPFVYLTAFLEDKKYTLATRLSNEPFTFTYDRQTWEPLNYEDKEKKEGSLTQEKKEVSAREALEKSINIPTARLATEVGIKKLVKTAQKLGIQSPLPAVPSLSLGSAEVTPLEIASAYSVLANGGIRALPISIKHVVGPNGEILEGKSIEIQKVISPEAPFLVTYALEGVLDRGTGRGARLFGFGQTAAGKTGTTNEYVDSWFAGYTPDLVGVSWVGFDKEKKVGLTGAQAALPLWTRFMMKATQSKPEVDFLIPENIVFQNIDPETGELSTSKCPSSFKEAFIKGTEPKTTCEIHNPKKKKKEKTN